MIFSDHGSVVNCTQFMFPDVDKLEIRLPAGREATLRSTLPTIQIRTKTAMKATAKNKTPPDGATDYSGPSGSHRRPESLA